MIKVGSVSYTHLDVYKRQFVAFGQQLRKISAVRMHFAVHILLSHPSCNKLFVLTTKVPVSYTHLDVYKRQDQVHVKALSENTLDIVRLVFSKQPVIDENTGQILADRSMDQ